jgi:hypothetical protein
MADCDHGRLSGTNQRNVRPSSGYRDTAVRGVPFLFSRFQRIRRLAANLELREVGSAAKARDQFTHPETSAWADASHQLTESAAAQKERLRFVHIQLDQTRMGS